MRKKQCVKSFATIQFQQIPREENIEVDVLAKTASTDEIVGDQVKIQYIPSIDMLEVNQVDGVTNWTTPLMSYLKGGVLPDDKEKAKKLRVRAVKLVLLDEVLYKRGFSQPYMRCLNPDKSLYVLRDVYEGAYGNHSGARSLVYKMIYVE